ncbi:Afadin [Caenorhabditis elegans]|uniref:Afadin n=5 Tax=Caenorhabditis elegans TaxID=6239 RepID=X5LPT9_CAEEL|nr:Afadin [Caenorhabditis elegans]CDO41086.1 Afadin [Caenorhabditis elegans]|eukprot:NP_001293329.1 AFaDin (actin filament binding protein) homolog [Caenorhabditis elegans]
MVSEREQLACLVQQWNENRLDLFHLSYPTEDLEVEGVMRFYFQDGGEKVLTKCVRVSSTATTRAVVDALSEKFLPDLKMLSNDTYSLWEVHENGEERKLLDEEKPLVVQLQWHKDDREGRFLLKKDAAPPVSLLNLQEADQKNTRFAKKKDKEPKKKNQKNFVSVQVNGGREEAQSQDDIYKQVPFNTFTRTISNPEAVMRKRREKKLETKLKEMMFGGSLKVYGGEIVPTRPYVSILAEINENADRILGAALEKYGLEHSKDDFILVEVSNDDDRKSMSDLREIDGRPIPPTECPLFEMTARSGNGENGFDSFLAIKRKPHDYQVPSTSVVAPSSVTLPMSPLTSLPPQIHNLPVLIVMNNDGHLSTHRITLHEGVTEVGSDSQMSNFSQHNIYLDGPDIRGRHAAIAFMEGVVTLTPSTRDAYLEVNGHQLMQTEILRDGDHIRIGADHSFKFSTSSSQANQINSTNISNSNQRHFQQQTFYPEMADSRASTARCAPSDYCSLPQQNDYYPPSMSGSSVSSSRQEDLMMHSNNNILPPYSTKSAQEPLQLPLSIQIGDYNVWDFLAEVMSNRAATSSEMSTFRLSPAYSLYLALRSFHTHNKPYSVQFFSRIESNFKQIAQECSSKDDLIFWLANASEFNHLVERDTELKASRYGKISVEIERIFRRLVAVLQSVIRPAARALLDIHLNDHDATGDVIHLLDTTMRQARICGLNAALTIQLCGHLLHMVNAFVFNSLVSVNLPAAQLNTRLGKCLQYRIESIHRFCERMGVEMAAECHLDRSRQAANLLATQKNDVAALGSTCYKLNSLQVVHILSGFEPDDGEIPCDDDVVDRICRLAEKQADKLTLEDGQRVTLEESDELNLPFLIPQDGYFVEQFRTVPDGLWQYLQQLQHRRLCHTVSLTPAPPAAMTHSMHAMHIGASDAHYHQHQHQQQQNPIVRSVSQTTLTSIPTTQFGDSFGSAVSDTISKVTLRKNGGGIGLSIVAAQGVGDRQMGIYVKKVVEGTPAAHDGRLETGDQLLSVNGHSLIGISQEDAARLMTQSGNEVHFDVRKRAAHRNGLSNWLGSQTPTTSNFIAPSPSTVPPPSYSHVGRTPSYDGQPPPSYNHRNGGASGAGGSSGRNSAFVAPLSNSSSNASSSHMQQHYAHHNMMHNGNLSAAPGAPAGDPKHYRSSSASDLQHDPNASFSQSSMTGSARSSVFDKLPSHYRHSTRPTVIQPTRPSAQSPSALRKAAAASPVSNLYRPTSASNLFAPPRNSGGLVGYSSNAARESTQDIHRAEPAIVIRPVDLNMPKATPPASIRGAVPTAITQALQLQPNGGGAVLRQVRPASGLRERLQDADVRNLEKTNTALMSYEAVNEELDRLDAKQNTMTIDEQRRYRELLNVVAEQSRARKLLSEIRSPPTSYQEREIPIHVQKEQQQHRRETVIDDIPHSSSSVENVSPVSPPESRKVQFIDEVVQYQTPTSGANHAFFDDVPVLDSPGIVGTNEIYRDPRQRRLNELQDRNRSSENGAADGAKLGFRDKQRLFARQIGEDTAPRQRMNESSAQRLIETDIAATPQKP